jgi:L-amino acid N-acyltransferase YncA
MRNSCGKPLLAESTFSSVSHRVTILPSDALHRRFGFEPVGRLREVGFKFGKRINTVFWQKALG